MLAFRDRHRWLLLERSQKPPVKSKVSEREETTRHYVHDSLFKNTSAQDETDTAEPQSRQLLDVVLSQMNIFLDSDLTIGSRSSNTEFSLTEAYRRRSWGGLVKRKIAHWREGYGLELLAPRITAARRMNQHQELVKSAMVVTNNDTLNHLGDDVDRHIDSLTKANHVHLAHVLRILNASVEMKATDSWGYLQNGSWSGLAGYLQRGEVDIGCTAMFMLPSRLPIVHFISAPVKTKSAFLFRPPPLSFVQNIFTLPFSRAVWLSSVALLALMGALLYCNLKLEFRRGEHTLQSAAEPVKASWSDVVLLSFGVVCQQGAEVEARGVSGRTITFLLYISVIFLYTSYSACIVALLQSTTDSIQTLRDLYESGMEMGVLDIVYSHHFFSIASDPLRRSIYTKKINPPGGPSNFFSLEEGLAKVRKGLFAFHHELGPGYYIVSNTFLEEEKCGLHTVTYSQDFVSPWIAVTKNSPLKEIFAIAYRMLHESGLQIRESERFYQKKPDCSSAGSSFVSVGIADCYPALLVLGYGALCSLLAFLLERLVHNKFSGRVEFEATCWRAVERLPAFPRTKQS
ncbi:probable glutamate receptor [Periplaneta americana]|uniref:probable glutamate receptor n=1 Tax=Periplaneta americana TaxID=6978 RepID=UPI0037E8E14F